MANSLIERYFQAKDPATIPPGFLAYLANLECVARVAPEVARSIVQELADQRSNVKLIASENYSSLAAQCAMGNLLTDKYAEGIPHHRFYAGCDNVDSIEDLAGKRACELFGARFANVQPHAGANANLAAYLAVLQAGDTVLGMRLDQGGHLTHGSPVNISGRIYNFVAYGVTESDERLDYDQLAAAAKEHRP